ncbi:MAG: PilZ domain-containing protein [Burkholderiales bacterium]|nr:PilZ domain-containing protein [Burkholderiales bacterium]
MSDTLDNEVRMHPRKQLSVVAKVAVGEKAPLDARGVDVSLGGVCLLLPESIAFGEFCVVKFEVDVGGSTRQFSGVAKSVYSAGNSANGFRTGFQFFRLDEANTSLLADFINQQ